MTIDNDDIKIWNGILFIKDGVYEKSTINFKIIIPNTYPSNPPSVTFITKIYHPLINLENGELDLKVIFFF